MLKHRVIPCLTLVGDGLVKTVGFANPVYVGDPLNAIRIFNEKEVDELMFLDITATKDGREPNFQLLAKVAGECFMPLAYGGAVRTVEQARRIFALGVEKVCLQTAALDDLSLITRLADEFGRQSVVVNVDVKNNWLGQRKLFRSATGMTIGRDWQAFLSEAVEAGAGEVVISSVDRDGTMTGMDVDLIAQAARLVSVPVVAVGGVGAINDLKAGVDAGASAVAVGAFFVFHGPHRAVLITYPPYGVLEATLGEKRL